MSIAYTQEQDRLTVTLKPEGQVARSAQAGDFTVSTDAQGELVKIEIAHASQFVARALAAGISTESTPIPAQGGMVWYDTDSSMISAFGYDPEKQIMEVVYRRGGVYRYYDVPPQVFEGLRDAPSKGRYMHDAVIDIYPTSKRG